MRCRMIICFCFWLGCCFVHVLACDNVSYVHLLVIFVHNYIISPYLHEHQSCLNQTLHIPTTIQCSVQQCITIQCPVLSATVHNHTVFSATVHTIQCSVHNLTGGSLLFLLLFFVWRSQRWQTRSTWGNVGRTWCRHSCFAELLFSVPFLVSWPFAAAGKWAHSEHCKWCLTNACQCTCREASKACFVQVKTAGRMLQMKVDTDS